jgi:tryptophan synthase beta subunit
MKLRGIRRIALALALGVGAITAIWGAGQHSIASAPAQHRLAGEAMPPVPLAQSVVRDWSWGND